MRARLKGFTLIEMLIVAAMATIVTLAGASLFIGQTDAVRSAEARATMDMLRDRARTVYVRESKVPNKLEELRLSPGDVASTYFNAESFKFNSSVKNWKVSCQWVYISSNPPHLTMQVDLVTGAYEYKRP